MELFYSSDISCGICRLDEDESAHAVKVLRHREGDEIRVIDGQGTMYRCVLESHPLWGTHPYRLTLAVCPTKNNDRYEWFAEKATEVGVDSIVPVIGEHSERRVLKTDRLRRVVLSATKQSLKASLPQVAEPLSVKDFILSSDPSSLRLIACCFESDKPRRTIRRVLSEYEGGDITVMIGPEGDFSEEEVRLALDRGFIPISLGDSRLRTETAAVTAANAVYFRYMD